MIVYLDLLIIFNFIINFLSIIVLEILYYERPSILQAIIGGVIGGLLVLAFLCDYFIYNLLRLLGGIIIILVGVKKNSFSQLLLKAASFYIINFTLVGFVASFQIKQLYLFLIAFFVLVFLLFMENNKKTDIFINSLKYNISVTFNNKDIHVKAFLDTGNFSKVDDTPIIFMKKKYQPNCPYYKLITLTTVNASTIYKAYKPTKFEIIINNLIIKRDVLVVFTNIKDFECLLNADLFIMEGGKHVKEII